MWRSDTPVTPLICRIEESFMSLYNKLEGELSIKIDIDLCNKYQTRGIMNREDRVNYRIYQIVISIIYENIASNDDCNRSKSRSLNSSSFAP